MARGRRILPLATVCGALAFAGCGGDGDGTSETGGTGAQGPSGAASDITAGEFIAKLRPEKELTLEAIVATEPACEGVDLDEGFLLLVTSRATEVPAEEPITPVVVGEC